MTQLDPGEENARMMILFGYGFLMPLFVFVPIFFIFEDAIVNSFFRLMLEPTYLVVYSVVLALIGLYRTWKFPSKYSVAPYVLGLVVSHAIILGILAYRGII